MDMDKLQNKNFLTNIVTLLQSAKQQVVRSVNQTMVITYFEIGRMIVEEQQNGKERAEYRKAIVKDLSRELTKEFGKGFSVDNLEKMRRFYLVYGKSATLLRILEKQNILPLNSEENLILLSQLKDGKSATPSRKLENITQTLSAVFKLSWSHYLTLMRIDNEEKRQFYEIEAFKNNWSIRELKRQYDTALYTRLTLSRDKEKVKELSIKGQILEHPKDTIKDPYVLEFIGLPENTSYSENELEQKIIDKLEHFLLELGTGFTFVARQKRISFDDKHFRIDLVFYNRVLKSFVLIDLKIGELKHQDIGQMQMYVNYYDREIRLDDENKTIGIILCQNKSESVVEYTLPENNEQIFASKYKTVLPSKNEFKKIINE